MPSDQVTAIQRCYPEIYLACHVDHVRARSTAHRLSAKDSMLLGHLDEKEGIQAGDLARHLGVAASTLSAALQRLEGLGYLRRSVRAADRRAIELYLTPLGATAMAATSSLDPRRVEEMLGQLDATARRRAIDGLRLLAAAAEQYRRAHPTRRSH